jgi:phage FluMu gp28-like protein
LSVLYPFQKELVNRNNKLEINVKARQLGYSFSFAYKCLKRGLTLSNNQLIVSASQRQSNVVMGYVEKFWRNFKLLPSTKNIKMVVDSRTEKQFKLSDGKLVSINCLPAKSETIQGFPGDVFLDEFALYKNDKAVLECIMPSITHGYNLTISSKPLGRNNMFFNIYHNIDNRFPDYKRYGLNIYQAIEQGLVGKGRLPIDIEVIKRNMDEGSFRQEYLLEFTDDSSSYFPYRLIRNCVDDYGKIQGESFMGVDVGRTKDRTAIYVVTKFNDNFYITASEVLNNTPFDEQKAVIKQMFYESNVQKVKIDKGAIGYQLAEELEKEINAEGVMFGNPVKVDLCTNAKKIMEQKRLHITDDRDLISDIHSIQKQVTSNNLVQFNSPRDEKGHGDRAWALFLALSCATYSNEIKIGFV